MLYIGMYLKCKRDMSKVLEVADQVKLCSNSTCQNSQSHNNNIVQWYKEKLYCPDCGAVTYYYKTKKKLSFGEIEGNIFSENQEVLKGWKDLYYPTFKTFIYYPHYLNKTNIYTKDFDKYAGGDADLLSMLPLGMPSAVEEGTRVEVWEIEDLLKKHYDEVKICWGVVYKSEYNEEG